MDDPRSAIIDWYQLVKPGGYLIILVPDKDLYEQGAWPSMFNSEHKWTFTIKKNDLNLQIPSKRLGPSKIS